MSDDESDGRGTHGWFCQPNFDRAWCAPGGMIEIERALAVHPASRPVNTGTAGEM